MSAFNLTRHLINFHISPSPSVSPSQPPSSPPSLLPDDQPSVSDTSTISTLTAPNLFITEKDIVWKRIFGTVLRSGTSWSSTTEWLELVREVSLHAPTDAKSLFRWAELKRSKIYRNRIIRGHWVTDLVSQCLQRADNCIFGTQSKHPPSELFHTERFAKLNALHPGSKTFQVILFLDRYPVTRYSGKSMTGVIADLANLPRHLRSPFDLCHLASSIKGASLLSIVRDIVASFNNKTYAKPIFLFFFSFSEY
jgi:hypothetical protein